jgi:ribonuclease HI
MQNISIFTDVSLNPKLKDGLGAMLIIDSEIHNISPDQINRDEIINKLKFKFFNDTSSSKLEVETLLWALSQLENCKFEKPFNLSIYTDSQCICSLLGRKDRLESQNYISKGSGKIHKNAELYKSFYEKHKILNFSVNKVKGHAKNETHDAVTRVFSYIDKEVRNKFRLD